MRIPQELMAEHAFVAFPELQKYEHKIHFIDATIGRREIFLTRDTIELVEELKQAYRQGKTKFFFYMFTEAVMSHIVFKIHRLAKLLNNVIPSENFFYLSGAINGEEAYEKVAQQYGFTFRISVLSAPMFHYYLRKTTYTYSLDYNTFEAKVKPKKFLCFNKLEREQRLRLTERMLEKNYVDLGYYSFESSEKDNFHIIADRLDPMQFPHIKANKDKFPLRLNITEDRSNPVNIIPDDLEYFKNSYFSIVNETLYYGFRSSSTHVIHHQPNAEYSSVFISEKTFKCLALKHPFVVFGRPGMLKGLHKLGFKTFSPYFNESYDDIIDDNERFDAIFNEITRLINLSDDEWLEILRNIEPILEYNHMIFINKDRHGVTENTERFFADVQPKKQLKTLDEVLVKSDCIELMPIVEVKHWSMQTARLSSGIVVEYPNYLNGGGLDMVDELVNVIRTTGKASYDRGCEWCAGFGVLGFDVLGLGLAKHMVFTDYYSEAIKNCLDTASKNNISDKVTGYISGTIKGIPNEKWDLVISNPPHVFDKEFFIETLPGGKENNANIDNSCRLIVDQNFAIHKEFFKNIKEKLTKDADVYLIEALKDGFINEWAEQAGLYVHATYPISALPHGQIFHFKLK
jgi:16S rRNA G1207 methylase RsmC